MSDELTVSFDESVQALELRDGLTVKEFDAFMTAMGDSVRESINRGQIVRVSAVNDIEERDEGGFVRLTGRRVYTLEVL